MSDEIENYIGPEGKGFIEQPKLKTFYITFGSAHLAGFGLRFHLIIKAPDELTARKVIAKRTDGKWAGIYKEQDAEKCVLRYGTQCMGTIVAEDEYSDNNVELRP